MLQRTDSPGTSAQEYWLPQLSPSAAVPVTTRAQTSGSAAGGHCEYAAAISERHSAAAPASKCAPKGTGPASKSRHAFTSWGRFACAQQPANPSQINRARSARCASIWASVSPVLLSAASLLLQPLDSGQPSMAVTINAWVLVRCMVRPAILALVRGRERRFFPPGRRSESPADCRAAAKRPVVAAGSVITGNPPRRSEVATDGRSRS